MKDNLQIKSKSRVNDYGEVFTASREVNAMLDLVQDDSFLLETVLEPACGSGNFLVAVLNRKVNTIKLRYHGDRVAFERALVLAVSTLYGVDIQSDNVAECRSRLLQGAKSACESWNHKLEHALQFILRRNIQTGNTLQLSDPQGRPLTFSEWSMLPDGTMLRKDYTLSEILHHDGEYNDCKRQQYHYKWLKEALYGTRERSSVSTTIQTRRNLLYPAVSKEL